MRRCDAYPSPTARPPGPGGLPRCAAVLLAVAVAAALPPDEASAQDWFVLAGPERKPATEAGDGGCSGIDCAAGRNSPLRPRRDLAGASLFEPGIGGAAPPALGFEVVVEPGAGFVLEGRASPDGAGDPGSDAARRSSLTELISPYVDLPAIGGSPARSVSPFIGGGLGAVRMRSGKTRMSFPKIGNTVPGEGRVGRAWTVTAGVAVPVGSRSTLEFAWRYTDVSEVKTGRGSGQVEWRGRGRSIPLHPAPSSDELRSHGLRLSLRYGF